MTIREPTLAAGLVPALLVVSLHAGALAAGVEGLAAPKDAWRFAQGQAAITREVAVNASWRPYAALSFRVALSRRTIHTVRLLVYLVTDEGWWYQSAELAELEITRSRLVSLDLEADSGDWVPRGHLRPWDGHVVRRVRAVGLKAFCDGQFGGSVVVKGVELVRRKPGARQRLRLLDFEAPREARVGEPCEIRFRLPWVFDNPFDPKQIHVLGHFGVPDDESYYRLVPGFFYQGYFPRWEGGPVRRVPVGPAEWRIRFWPDRAGPHKCTIVVWTPTAQASIPWAFTVAPAPKSASLLPLSAERIRKLGPSDFIIERKYNGRDTLYIHRPGGWRADGRTPPPGTLKAWRVPLEWTRRWGGYGGIGRFNMAIAAEFDGLLDRARARGVALPLALTCNEPFGERAKYNWKDNPLNKTNGGPLAAPSEFLTRSDVSWPYFENRSRYILARWGGHPAVAGWELWCTMPANNAAAWHARAGEHLATYRLGPKDIRCHHPQTVPPAASTMLNTFARKEMLSRDRWMAHRVIRHNTQSVQTVSAPATDGNDSLEIVASYPGEAAILRAVEEDWHTYDRLAFDIYVPPKAPNDMRVMIYLRDGDLWWFETLLPVFLRRGDWTKLLVDLTGQTTKWTPQGHAKVFDRYALQRVRVLGLRVFGGKTYRGPLYLDNIQLWRDPKRRKRIKITHLHANTLSVPRYGTFELTFRLSKTFANPFDPDGARIDGHFTAPSGKTRSVPAFFYQDYERHLQGGREVLTPKGRPCWKLRFTPTETTTRDKPYTYSVSVNGRVLAGIRDQQFDVIPSANKGFIRRSKRDPRYFEHSTGQFYYPIGINLRSPSDNRKPYPLDYALPEGKGTFVYDDYYKKLGDAGVNWVRIWQCPWWCGLEWTRKWPGFQGLGRYNMESAWRFDYLMNEAAKRGIYVQACLTNHGQIVIDKRIDRQWDSNPLNADLGEGGPLHDASSFYTDRRAKELFKQRLRYTIARWGHATHLMAFVLFSEMEFTKAYWDDHNARRDNSIHCQPVVDWVGDMARHLKSIDPFGHLVTTHFSHPWRGHDVWGANRRTLDFTQSNAYSTFTRLYSGFRNHRGIINTIDYFYDGLMSQFDLPVLIAEYGGHWMGSPAQLLDAELHTGIWTSVTSHLAGSTGYWWWLHVHYHAKGGYHHFRAATRYMAGEDRRSQNLRHEKDLQVRGGPLKARGLLSRTHAYIWVYNPAVATSLDGNPDINGASLDLPDIEDGQYSVEFWNTYTGAVDQRRTLAARGNRLRIPLPTVRNDLALKIKPAPRPR